MKPMNLKKKNTLLGKELWHKCFYFKKVLIIIFDYLFIYFIFGCAGSLLMCVGFV